MFRHLSPFAWRRRAIAALFALPLALASVTPSRSQQIDDFDRKRGREMLNVIKKDIRDNYYDQTFKGIDLDAKFKGAEDMIMKAQSNSQIFAIIAQTVIDFDDSHTRYFPPQRSVSVEYGVAMQMIGDTCYVLGAKPNQDAARKLSPGDRILSIAGIKPTRTNFWKISYMIHHIRPSQTLQFVVESPDGKQRQADVVAEVKQLGRFQDATDPTEFWKFIRELEDAGQVNAHRYFDNVENVFFWRMTEFDLDDQEVDKLFGKAKERKAMVLDLRGNPGGDIKTLHRMVANLFDHDVKVYDLNERAGTKPVTVKTRGGNAFKAQLVVLVDSDSGSCSELLARIVQLEKRGVVVGDRSAGAVMQSRFFSHQIGGNIVMPFSSQITNGDFVMADGKSLEKAGVQPDEVIMPTAADLAAQRDPALARAAELAGVKLEPAKAGAMFPIVWER